MALKPTPVPDEWETPLADYFIEQTAAGTPATTQYTRRQHLSNLARGLGGSPWTVTPEQLLGWFAERDWLQETRRSRRTTFRHFWAWGVATGRTEQNTAAILPVVKASAPKPRPIPAPYLHEGMEAADQRTELILRLAAEAGMRRGEIAQAHSRDLLPDLDGYSIIAHGKGGKDRVIPLNTDLAAALLKLGSGYFFPGRVSGHLSAKYVGKLATRVLPGEWTLHTGRHRFAVLSHRESKDLLIVQDLLGHASPATTRAYVGPDPQRARLVVQALPRAA
jgi:integrase